ncbi:hypothetical protein SAMN05216411_1059 [Nitrosospira multiformis]|nr:hypothetical protein SAMN05216411_1059 [Nitrosospira multiformis]
MAEPAESRRAARRCKNPKCEELLKAGSEAGRPFVTRLLPLIIILVF